MNLIEIDIGYRDGTRYLVVMILRLKRTIVHSSLLSQRKVTIFIHYYHHHQSPSSIILILIIGATIHKKLPERFNTSVHNRLSTDRPLSLSTAASNTNPANYKPEVYRRKENRKLEEIEREEHCTFKPKVYENPFVSGRCLGQLAYERNRENTTDNMIDTNIINDKDNSKRNTKLGLGGQFFIGLGYVEGPPSEPGLDLFLFNVKYPPNFDEGTYQILEEIESLELTTVSNIIASNNASTRSVSNLVENNNDDDIPPAPPLPKMGGQSGGTNNNKSLIKTPAVKKGAPAPASGWQQVLDEMKAKRDSILKVTTDSKPKSPEKKSVGKLSMSAKKHKRKSGFTDVIDELSYTLAKMRGEVVDDGDDDDDDEDEPPPPPKKTVASKLFTPSAPLPPPAPSTTPTASSNVGVIAVPTPNELPCPPPLPEKSWPKPVPYVAPKQASTSAAQAKPKLIVDTNLSENSNSIVATSTAYTAEPRSSKVVHTTKVVSRMLPSGYYMPTEVIGSIYPGSIVPSGKTTTELILSLSQKFENSTRLSMTMENDDMKKSLQDVSINIDSEGNFHVEGKLTVSDLPLPCSFHKSVQRLITAKETRENARKLQEATSLRNYDTDINKDKTADRPRSTTPKPFHLCTQERSESKQHSFRSSGPNISTVNAPKSKFADSMNYSTSTKLNKTNAINANPGNSSQSLATAFTQAAKMKRSSFISMSNIIDVSTSTTNKPDDAFNKLSMGLSSIDILKRDSYSKKRQQKQKEEEDEEKERQKIKKEMLFKKALETAKKSGVYNNNKAKADSYTRELHSFKRKLSADTTVNLETLSSNHKKYFNINPAPIPVFGSDSAFITPQHHKPFVSGSSISKGNTSNH